MIFKGIVIYPNVEIGDGTVIEHNVIIGYDFLTNLRSGYKIEETIIGKNCLIRPNSIIYAGCKIGDNSHINQLSCLREFTEVGHHSKIGSLVFCEGYTKIGNYVTIHSQTHLTALMEIGDYVFIGPCVGTANGYRVDYFRKISNVKEKGPTIKRGAVIGAHAMILPEITIGEQAIVGAGSVVTKDVPDFKVVMGIPAKIVRDITDEERLTVC